MSIKECLINGYLEGHVKTVEKSGDLERAEQEWKKELTCSRLPKQDDRFEIESAGYTLAASYHVDGLNAGFDLACRAMLEILAAALKGGESA